MSLFRCSQLLSRQNGSLLSLFKHSTGYYSDEKKPNDEVEKADAQKKDKPNKKSAQTKGDKKELSKQTQSAISGLLGKLSENSALKTVRKVQLSKPHGYQNIRKGQQVDARDRRPKNIKDAAQAVSDEFGIDNMTEDLIGALGLDNNDTNKRAARRTDDKSKEIGYVLSLKCQRLALKILSLYSDFSSYKGKPRGERASFSA